MSLTPGIQINLLLHRKKIRAIFKETRRSGEWNSMLGLGIPAASLEVQKYPKASTEEELRARITPSKQFPYVCPNCCFWTVFE